MLNMATTQFPGTIVKLNDKKIGHKMRVSQSDVSPIKTQLLFRINKFQLISLLIFFTLSALHMGK